MIQAKINGKWGEMPENMLPELPENGTVVAFEFLYSYRHPATKKPTYKLHENLKPIVTVRNPKNKTPMEIGLIGGVDNNGSPLPYEIRRVNLQPQAGNGLHYITIGNSTAGDELYQFMMLSSENELSAIRDEGIVPVYRTKDFVADAKARVAAKNKRREAQGIALSLKGAELKETAALLGINPNQDANNLLDQIEDDAVKNPEKFLSLTNDPDRPAKSVLATGLANGSLSINQEASAIVYADGGSQVLHLTSTNREDAMEQFAEYIRTDNNGKKTLTALKAYVDSKAKISK